MVRDSTLTTQCIFELHDIKKNSHIYIICVFYRKRMPRKLHFKIYFRHILPSIWYFGGIEVSN